MNRGKVLPTIPRSVRAILNLVIIGIVIFALYVSQGSPTFSATDQFRREEIRQMVGPAKILNNISLKKYTVNNSYNRLIIAASDDSATLYLYHNTNTRKMPNNYSKFVCRKKQGNITVLAVPSIMHEYDTSANLRIPVIVFDCFPEAVRAEMEIELYSNYIHDIYFRRMYQLEATRNVDGYFLFDLENDSAYDGSGTAMKILTMTSSDMEYNSFVDAPIPVTVRFYDKNNVLISTESVEIRSVSGEAHTKRE